MIIDTHAHLYWDSFHDDFQVVLDRCLQAEVSHLINVGVDVETSQKAVDLTSDKLKFFSTIGIHPHEAIKYFHNPDVSIRKDIDRVEDVYHQNVSKVIGVGECGLDYLGVDNQLKDLQKKLFQAQIDLAKKLNLPLIVHCRDDRSKDPQNSQCWDEVIKMVGTHPTLLHCYSGLDKTTDQVIKSPNLFFSFAGNITYPKNEYLREAATIIPLDRILVETDCPFLPPQAHRGQRNEPSFIVEVIKTISGLKKMRILDVEQAIFKNSYQFFNLPLV